MTTQKTFKRRVRARAAKTGESYAAARAQLVSRTDSTSAPPPVDHRELTGVSEAAMVRGSGRPIGEWLELLDRFGAMSRPHREVAAWLQSEHGVPGWYAQSITVGYERARGLRVKHQTSAGFSVGATRTVRTSAAAALDAFTVEPIRDRWLPSAPMRLRTATAGRSARFDWDDPASRVVVGVTATGPDRVQVSVAHERLPDAETAERVKAAWRERLTALKELLEAG